MAFALSLWGVTLVLGVAISLSLCRRIDASENRRRGVSGTPPCGTKR